MSKKKRSGFFLEFQKFVQKGNAIDMAVGVIVGAALGSLVNSLVKDVIMPPIGMLLKGVDFSQIFIVLHPGKTGDFIYRTIAQAQADGATTLNIGIFFNSLISFLITMFAIFLLVRSVNKIRVLDALTGSSKTIDCPYCFKSVNAKATRCPFCCSKLKPAANKPIENKNRAMILNRLSSKKLI